MPNKTANVTARIEPNIKNKAEAILNQIGIPVSVLIDTLYRQIIITGGIPYSLNVSKIQTLDNMSKDTFNEMIQGGYNDAQANNGLNLNKAFCEIRKEI